jgi:deazaflavin-dependent oxidoreductase (nitroreductase family)
MITSSQEPILYEDIQLTYTMEEFPRKGSALYDMLKGNEESKKRSLRNWQRMNRVVIFLYELGILPLIGLGYFILLLHTRGRRTGKTYVTPLEYRKQGISILLFSSRGKTSDWYKNLRAHPENAEVQIGFKKYHPSIEFIEDYTLATDILRWYIEKHPRSSQFLFGWNQKKDNLETADLKFITDSIRIVRLNLV